MKIRIINVLLTFFLICSSTFFAKADKVVLRKSKNTGGVRSLSLDPSHLSIDLDGNVIHINFIHISKEVNLGIVSPDGREVYQQIISTKTASIDIDLSKEEPGVFIIYFVDSTGTCLYGELIIL